MTTTPPAVPLTLMLVAFPTQELGLLPLNCLLQYQLHSQYQQALLSFILALAFGLASQQVIDLLAHALARWYSLHGVSFLSAGHRRRLVSLRTLELTPSSFPVKTSPEFTGILGHDLWTPALAPD
jgi:hypothetical protein